MKGQYSVVVERFDGLVHDEVIIAHSLTCNEACDMATQEEARILDASWQWSEDYQNYQRMVGKLWQWFDVQVRHKKGY